MVKHCQLYAMLLAIMMQSGMRQFIGLKSISRCVFDLLDQNTSKMSPHCRSEIKGWATNFKLIQYTVSNKGTNGSICFNMFWVIFWWMGDYMQTSSALFPPSITIVSSFFLGCKHFLITSRFPFSSWCWWDLQSYGGAERYMELIHRDLDNTGLRLQRMCASNTEKSRPLTTWDQEKDWCVESESKHHEQRCMRKREQSQSETSSLRRRRRRRSTGSLGTEGAAAELPLYWLYKVILHCCSSRRWTK